MIYGVGGGGRRSSSRPFLDSGSAGSLQMLQRDGDGRGLDGASRATGAVDVGEGLDGISMGCHKDGCARCELAARRKGRQARKAGKVWGLLISTYGRLAGDQGPVGRLWRRREEAGGPRADYRKD